MSNTSTLAKAKLSPNQVSMLAGRAAVKGLHGDRLLEWLEFECDVNVMKLENVPASRLSFILEKLERLD